MFLRLTGSVLPRHRGIETSRYRDRSYNASGGLLASSLWLLSQPEHLRHKAHYKDHQKGEMELSQ